MQAFGDKKARQCWKFLDDPSSRRSLALSALVSEPGDLFSAILQHADNVGFSLEELISEEALHIKETVSRPRPIRVESPRTNGLPAL